MTRWKVICAYDGTDFAGWQSQSAGNAVQDVVESALGAVLRADVRIHGAGRTDAGVHARGQCFHFDADWRHPGEALGRAVHAKLPGSIRLRSIRPADPDFHARHSAVGKRYEYRLSTREPDPFSIRYRWHLPGAFDARRAAEALPFFAGTHNYAAFAGKVCEGENPVKTLCEPELVHEGGGDWTLRVEGDGFLYRMVRSIAGTLARVAAGRLAPGRIPELLRGGRRTPEVHTAPARGLFLEEVFYAGGGGGRNAMNAAAGKIVLRG
ncbi:MAG: tRNA pseudouridine(38-40) synthase TruA [Puniceicoccaceae bacterium]